MYLNKKSRTTSRKIGPKFHRSFLCMFNCGHGVLLMCAPSSSILVSSDHRNWSRLKYQTEYAWSLFLDEREGFFLKTSQTICGDVGAILFLGALLKKIIKN